MRSSKPSRPGAKGDEDLIHSAYNNIPHVFSEQRKISWQGFSEGRLTPECHSINEDMGRKKKPLQWATKFIVMNWDFGRRLWDQQSELPYFSYMAPSRRCPTMQILRTFEYHPRQHRQQLTHGTSLERGRFELTGHNNIAISAKMYQSNGEPLGKHLFRMNHVSAGRGKYMCWEAKVFLSQFTPSRLRGRLAQCSYCFCATASPSVIFSL
jgi:hypothetical protein